MFGSIADVSVLALHELTEKADCVLPVENQVRGGGGRGWEEQGSWLIKCVGKEESLVLL